MYWKTSSSIMECSMAVLYAILTMSSLAYANQGEPGLNERTLEEGHLPSSSLSSPVLSNVPGLINMTSEGTIKTNSIGGSPVRSSPSMMTRSTVVSTVRVSSPQSMISPTTVYSLSVKTSVYLSSSVMPPLPTSSPLPGVPDPPVILDTNVLSAHSVLINWNTTTGQIISNYSVELSVNFSSWKNAVCNGSVVPGDCVVTQKQAVIIKLKPYTNYTFRVKARDQFGTSNYSTESKTVLTDEAAPSGAPSITAAHAISSQEIFVAWQPPPTEMLNGKLQKYEIYVKKITSVQPTTLPTRKIVATTYIVHGTGSSVRITGVASLSSSFTSVPSTFKPTTPVRIPGVGSLSSSFTSVPSTLKPTTPGRAFPVTEPVKPTEELEEQRTDQSGSFGVIDAGLVLNYTIANLDKWTIYELKVRAVTIAPGPFSDKVIVRTNEDVPSQPLKVFAKTVNSTAIFVNWSEPAEMNGLLVKYQVKYSAKYSLESAMTKDVGQNNIVVLTSLNPFTPYVINVSAFTSKGEGSHASVEQLTDEGRPSTPQNLSAQSVSSTKIQVSWKSPVNTNGKVKYRLSFYNTSEPSAAAKLVYDGNATQYLVSNLMPYTLYTFQVTAYNVKYDLSSAAIDTVEKTDQAQPSGPPRNVRAVTNSSSSIILYWLPPSVDQQNGVIRSYNIEMRGGDLVYTTINTKSNSTTFPITGLQAYTNYEFILQALNDIGVGPYSSRVSSRTFEAEPSGPPRNVSAMTNSSSLIILYWLPPSVDQQNGVIRSYNIKIRGGDVIYPTINTKSNSTTFPITGLQAYTNYEFMLRAVNDIGVGPYSSRVSSRTFEAEPSSPRNVTAKSVNSTAIKVTWIKALYPNGIIYYQLYRRLSKEDEQKDQVVYQGTGTSHVAANLQEYVMYTFTAVSINIAHGWKSKPVVVMETTLPAEPTGPPQDIIAWTLSSTSILVKWSPPLPLEQNGVILRYTVSYRSQSSQWKSLDTADNSTSIEVKDLAIFTKYWFTVRALNVIGAGPESESVYNTTSEDKPSGPPRNVSAMTNSSSSIILSWLPPSVDQQNGVIKSYNIEMRGGDLNYTKINTRSNSTTLPITGLQAYTNYEFMLQAVNDIGVGPYSSRVSSRTFEAEPSSPRNVTAKTVNSTAIKVTWIKVLHPNGIIYYQLYRRLSKEDEQKDQVVYQGTDTSHVAANLQEYVMYTFTVVSVNIRYGWQSKPVVVMETTHPAEPTGPPQDIIAWTLSSTSVLVKWSPPLPSEQNGVILRYTVSYRSQSSQWKSLDTADNSTSVEVKNLTIFTKYWFTVKALNVIGAGPESESVYNTTSEDTPSPPVNIAAKTVNSTAIKVTWQAPLYPNGEIYYRLYYWLSSEGVGTKRLAYDGPLLGHTVAGLHEYVTYTFTLQSYNVKYSWNSTATSAMETTHPAEPSGPPLNVKALTMSSTSMLVKWSPPSELDRNGIITHYIVKYSSLNSESFINTTDNATQILVKSLRKYTNYSFTVWAVNTIGVGPPSVDDARNTTSEDVPGEPVIISVIPKTNSLEVTWEPPAEPNGVITTFRLCWKLVAGHNTTCVSLNGGVTQHEIRNLTAFSEYNVTLAAGTSIGLGLSFTKVYKTAEGVPSKPQYLRAWNTSADSIFVTWKKPTSINGILKGYQVFSRLASDTGEPAPKNVGFRTNVTLSGLQPYRHYNVSVQALTGAGGGEKSYVLVMTDESAPSPVREVSIPQGEITWYSIEVTWFPPEKRNGEIGYYLSYWESSAGSSTAESFALPGSVHYKIVGGLKPFTNYTFSVVPYNLRKNLSGQPFIREGQTSATVPGGPPLNVKIVATTSESFTLTWDPPLEPNGIILGYDVMFYECDESNKKNIHDNIKEREHTIKNLHPYRCYRMYVACESSGGLGAYSDGIEHWTKPGVPPPLGTLAPPDKETIKSSSFIVELTQASNEMGVIGYYQVIVRELATDNRDQPVLAQDPEYYKVEDLYSYEEARKMKPQLVPYIAAEFRARDFDRYRNFVVGDGSRSSKVSEEISSRRKKRAQNTIEYYNGPLEENTFYAVFQRAYVNKDVYTSSSWIEPVETQFHVATKAIERPSKPVVVQSSPSVGLIVGIVLIILILPIIIAAIYFVWRKRQNSDSVLDDREDFSNGRPMRLNKMSRKRRTLQKKRLMGSTESLGDLEELAASRARRHPVPIDDFERHVDRMHMDGDHGFSEEYLLVQPDEEFSFQQFLNPANKYKNRYANIVAYDHTRVLLNPIDGVPGSDYINANFLDGYNRQRAYIAAQGPLMETFDDFWRMIWEQMSSIIVMLTKLEERGRRKCDQYWPERGTRNYGQVQVTLKETLNMSHYTVRKLVMTHKMYPDDERVVRQFHFTAWPDHGVPSHPTPLLSLVRHTFSASRECIGPMVVHCSAGVGRTGTFITLDVMLQRISQEDSVDVFGFVRQMRYQRNFMVQTEAQYVFIHDALLEAITCGVTEVEAKDLGARIRELRQVDSETGYTYLENEFCRLAKEENHPTAFKSASLNCNASKNRYANILPFESTRVHLKMRPGEMGSDYINANFIDGYCQPKAYIATQAPVPDTFEDFWRMVWEQESAAVVMLTREEEAGKVKCHHYWPSEGSRLYGVILVELIDEGSFGDYISRKFKLTHTEEKDSRTICQFQYTDWPDTGLPDSGVGIVDLIGQVQKWQQQSGNTAIVLHCSGGVGRTGVFCGISIMIERLKAEGVIDVFQTVQAMRLQRPAMVQTAEQYEFCYTTLQEYLDSFDLYANFQ